MAKKTNSEPETNPLIVQRADGSFMRVERVIVHASYVNANGSPRTLDGVADTGNYAIIIDEAQLAQFPQETIQGLAQIYDAALAAQQQ